MKNIFILSISLLVSILGFAQKIDTIPVSSDKTVLLIFDSKIKYGDIGSKKFLYDTSGTKLRIKSASKEVHAETSLHVETENGNFYTFILTTLKPVKQLLYNYKEKGKEIVNQPVNNQVVNNNKTSSVVSNSSSNQTQKATQSNQPQTNTVVISDGVVNSSELEKNAEKVKNGKSRIKDIGVLEKKMIFALEDIAVKDNELYFKFKIKNTSNIKFDIDLIRFVIRGTKGALKQKSVQEIEISPKLVYNKVETVNGKEEVICVFIADKFTIDQDKNLHIELWEKNGDRRPEMLINDKQILNVRGL